MSTREQIDRFLSQKRLTMVGVSREPKDFSRMLYREFRRRGYYVAPVHPEASEIEGTRCFARVQDVDPPAENVLLMTRPRISDQVVKDCAEAGVRRVWMYQAVGSGAVSPGAVDYCRQAGIEVIAGYCPFMFFDQPGFLHSAHAFLMKLTGRYPH
jgi:hypothetical protein